MKPVNNLLAEKCAGGGDGNDGAVHLLQLLSHLIQLHYQFLQQRLLLIVFRFRFRLRFRFRFQFKIQYQIQTYLAWFFFTPKKICSKTCLSNARSSIVSQKVGLYFFDFFTFFVLHFMLDPGPNPVPEPEPECIMVPVPLKQKVAVLAVPAVPVPQHCAAVGFQPELRIRIGSGFNQVSGSGFGIRIRIWIKEGKT
jgi:hypothetical protein